MMAETITQEPTTTYDTGSPRRRSARSRSSSAATPVTGRRGRRPRLGGEAIVANLAEMVDQLIKENRQLKRALAQAEKAQGGANLGQATKALSGPASAF